MSLFHSCYSNKSSSLSLDLPCYSQCHCLPE
nr:MAG TPA: hypothetical protein [Caudoviricetes sp.]